MPITIQDIANELNISKTTVHRSLTNRGRVSEETRSKVLKLAESMDYKPNKQISTSFIVNLAN